MSWWLCCALIVPLGLFIYIVCDTIKRFHEMVYRELSAFREEQRAGTERLLAELKKRD